MADELDHGAACSDYMRETLRIRSLCGSRGRMVGRFFAIVESRVVIQPRGTQFPNRHRSFVERDVPVWDVEGPIYNMQNLWHCDECETNYPTTFGPYEGCVGLGSSEPVTKRGGGECYGDV